MSGKDRIPPAAALLAILLLAAACTPGGVEAPVETTSTSRVPPTTTPTTTLVGERPLRIVGCDPSEEEVEIVCEAYELIQRHYVDPVPDRVLADAAELGLLHLDGAQSRDELACPAPTPAFIEVCQTAAETAEDGAEAAEAMVFGLAAFALDANSVYLDPAAVDLVDEEQDGSIEGIGALVTAEDSSSGEAEQCSVISATCRMFIVSTFAGSPAEQAGLVRDDVIVAVDGVDIEGWTIDEVTARVRGPAGSEVGLTVDRGGEILEMTITRAQVVIPVVTAEQVGDAGYVALTLFTESADEQLAAAIEDLLGQGIERLVLDMRDNPGGLLDTAIEVVSLFLDSGEVVVTEGPGSRTSYPVSGGTLLPEGVDLVLLVNGGSASASEVVAAVLQERGRATVVGESTFGKNTVQQRYGLSNGGALKLTIARWLTPEGLDFGEAGVIPDHTLTIDPGEPIEAVVETVTATIGGPS